MTTRTLHERALESVPVSLVITNPLVRDNPIIFVNSAFTRLTGYSPEVTIGRNCRFLQGTDTDQTAVRTLRDAVSEGREVAVELLNYRADGTTFLNDILITPLHDEAGKLQYFLGVQRVRSASDTRHEAQRPSDTALPEIHHRVKNHLAMVVGMIRMQARQAEHTSVENYDALARRIETLQLLYDEMTAAGDGREGSAVSLGAYVSRIATTVAYLDGRESVRLNLDVDDISAPIDTAAQAGLLVSELLTNAYQHAFAPGTPGLLEVRLHKLSEGAIRLQVADDGVGIPGELAWPDNGNLGGRIVNALLSGLDATIAVSAPGRGTVMTVDLPPPTFSPALTDDQVPDAAASGMHPKA
ncbi:MAG: PAS domain-containing protein [Pseudomonadota bacterium]